MKIGVAGVHGTGKTTLLNALRVVPTLSDYTFRTEVTRKLKKDLPINDRADNYDETQIAILREHLYNLTKFQYMITDRTVLDCAAYSWYLSYNNKLTYDIAYHIEMTLADTHNLYDILFYIEPEFELVSDGVRPNDLKFRDDVWFTFDTLIRHYAIPVVKLTGSVDERVKQVTQAIKEYYDKNTKLK